MPEAATKQAKATTPGTPSGAPRTMQKQPRRAPKSRYGVQMQEKQQLKEIFGIREEQLKKYYAEAIKSKEQTGQKLVILLESRLDNAVFRAGMAPTRPAARQMTTHRLFTVNDRPVDIPSYRLKPGDVVSVKTNKRSKPLFANFVKQMQNVRPPSWLTIDAENYSFTVMTLPSFDEVNIGVDVQAIVEYFAR